MDLSPPRESLLPKTTPGPGDLSPEIHDYLYQLVWPHDFPPLSSGTPPTAPTAGADTPDVKLDDLVLRDVLRVLVCDYLLRGGARVVSMFMTEEGPATWRHAILAERDDRDDLATHRASEPGVKNLSGTWNRGV